MPRIKTIAARSEAERVQITADVHALMAALQADEQPRQSPIYRWLDIRHDELLANLSGRRVNWTAFAAHLTKLGLTDGKGNAPMSSVARNTWQRVKSARAVASSSKNSAPSTAAPALADHHDSEVAQGEHSTNASTGETIIQEVGVALDTRSSSRGDYPPGVRAFAASETTHGSPGDDVAADSDSPQSYLVAASDRASSMHPSEAHHCIDGVTNWTAAFPKKPPIEVLALVRSSGGKWDKEGNCWGGASANDLNELAATVKAAGGSLQVSPGARPMI